MEVGSLVNERFGHLAQVVSYAGIHLWADRHVWVDANLGYRLVPAELHSASGPRAGVSLSINAW